MPASATGLIVVGVDGSRTSLAALRWAATEVSRRGGKLLAVRAVTDSGDDRQRSAERQILNASVRAALGDPPEVAVERRIEAGPAPRVLLAASSGADLLVVGSRGHSGLLGRILGSTAITVARGAEVPVVVVPAVPVGAHGADPAGVGA